MLKYSFYLLFIFSVFQYVFAQSFNTKVSGKVYDFNSGNELSNCNIIIIESSSGTISDKNGYYELLLPPGNHTLKFSYVGYKSETKVIKLLDNDGSFELNIYLEQKSLLEKEVTVTGTKDAAPIIKQKMESKDLDLMPNIYNDVLRSVQVFAGVSTNNELTSGYNVRGGSFDENLIYLNGYEIYRPFLLNQGIEENQTLVNPDMVSGISFYNGGFPARFGDRMSSALEVDYSKSFDNNLGVTFRADLMNMGATAAGENGKLSWKVGSRYSYPEAFLKTLQTSGDYSPSFSDIQAITVYRLNSKTNLEFLGLHAQNKFFLSPENWIGNFGGFTRGDVREIKINYDGDSEYEYLSTLAGLRVSHFFSENFKIESSISFYNTEEIEYKNITGDLFYNETALGGNEADDKFLKKRFEAVNNTLELKSYRFKTGIDLLIKNHAITAGIEYRIVNLTNQINENIYETGESNLLERPININTGSKYNLNNLSIFAEDDLVLTDKLSANVGLRYLYYNYSDENLFSPRITLKYSPSNVSLLTASWGYYYQPPFINELKNPENQNLKSQRSIHYTIGWSYKFKTNFTFSAEAYYKDMDNLIPYYFDELKMVYLDGNTHEGYAYGIDLQIDGQLIDDMRSIFGYSYLDSRQRRIGTTDYKRSLNDQTHTIQIFLQDKIKKHPNWQSHLRFLFGSGLLFYSRKTAADPETSSNFIQVDIDNPEEYFIYFRVDMGLSASFNISDKYKIVAVAEVLNVFNQLNYGSYDWIQALEEFNAPVRIPRVLSRRFFNVKLKLSF